MRHHPAPAYSPDALPALQALLATLADMDCAFDRDVETVAGSGVPDAIKETVIVSLRRTHSERRSSYLRRLDDMQRRLARSPGERTEKERPADSPRRR